MATRPLSRDAADVRRRFHRLPVIWSGRVEHGIEETSCTILNLSPGGAKLQLTDTEPCPARMRLTSPRFGQLNGRVVWRREDKVGLAFIEAPARVAEAVGGLLGEPIAV